MFVIAAPPQKWPGPHERSLDQLSLRSSFIIMTGGLSMSHSIRKVGCRGQLVTIMGNSTICLVSLLGMWYHLTILVGIKC